MGGGGRWREDGVSIEQKETSFGAPRGSRNLSVYLCIWLSIYISIYLFINSSFLMTPSREEKRNKKKPKKLTDSESGSDYEKLGKKSANFISSLRRKDKTEKCKIVVTYCNWKIEN